MKVIFALIFVAAFVYFGFVALKNADLLCRIPAVISSPQISEWAECVDAAPEELDNF